MYCKGYHDIDTKNFPFFSTDLAVEAHEQFSKNAEIAGVDKEVEEINNIKIERINVKDMQAGQMINKMPGNYVTIYAPGLRTKDTPLRQEVSKIFAKEFIKYINNLSEQANVLIVGLGNIKATPDSIGPLVTEKLIISRHFFQEMPDKVEKGFRSISAIAPGVMGQTGIETSDIVEGIIKTTKPDLLIVIDALASRSIERINTTIQIADTGINPGAGVGNKRKALNKETLGIPVIAVGVPTVVDAVTIVHDSLEYLSSYLDSNDNGDSFQTMPTLSNFMTKNMKKKQANLNSNQHKENIEEHSKKIDQHEKNHEQELLKGNLQHKVNYSSKYDNLNEQQKKQLIFQVLKSEGHQFMVTPKDIDTYIDEIVNIIAGGLNAALHPKITIEDAAMYTY